MPLDFAPLCNMSIWRWHFLVSTSPLAALSMHEYGLHSPPTHSPNKMSKVNKNTTQCMASPLKMHPRCKSIVNHVIQHCRSTLITMNNPQEKKTQNAAHWLNHSVAWLPINDRTSIHHCYVNKRVLVTPILCLLSGKRMSFRESQERQMVTPVLGMSLVNYVTRSRVSCCWLGSAE